jgi:hypothetical protein
MAIWCNRRVGAEQRVGSWHTGYRTEAHVY